MHEVCGDCGAAAAVRQPRGHGGCAGERGDAESEEADAPAEVVGQDAGGDATNKAAERCAADVEAHDERDAVGRPLLADVGDDDGDDAGDHDALQKSPEDELRKRSGGGGEKCRNGNAEERNDDDALARQGARSGLQRSAQRWRRRALRPRRSCRRRSSRRETDGQAAAAGAACSRARERRTRRIG